MTGIYVEVEANENGALFGYVEQGDGCWLWAGQISREGYGRIRNKYAHRVTYEMVFGPISTGLQLDHLCRNRGCVNPDHLEAVSQRENILRGNGASARAARQTHCLKGHPFTPDNVRMHKTRPNRRICKTCEALR